MKLKAKKIIFLSALGLLASSVVAGSVLSLTSCGKSEAQLKYELSLGVAKTLYSDYNTELSNAVGTAGGGYYQVTKSNEQQVINVVNKYLNETNNLINKLDSYQSNNMSTDDMNNFLDLNIWLRGIQFELETKLKLLNAKIRYLISGSYDQLLMTNYHKQFNSSVLSVANSYSSITPEQKATQLQNLNKYINDIYSNLEEGLQNNVTWSGVLAKHTIGALLQGLYQDELVTFASTTTVGGKLTNITGNLFNNQQYLDWAADNGNPEAVAKLIQECQSSLDKLMNFLLTDYYNGIKYGKSPGEDSLSITVSNTNPNEEDNSFSLKKDGGTIYISGLGLNTYNLNTNDIGIGFSGTGGQKIYEALLQKHTNITDVLTSDQYNLGDSQVADIKNAMQEVANEIANLKVGPNNEWKETYMYDADSSDDTLDSVEKTETLRAAGTTNVDLTKFFEWLNSDQFFNGRDCTKDQQTMIGNQEVKNGQLITPTNTNATNNYTYEAWPRTAQLGTDKDYVLRVIGYIGDIDPEITITLGDAGNLYVKYIKEQLSPETIQDATPKTFVETPHSISPEAAYIGASKAVRQYLEYKESTVNHLTSVFAQTNSNYTLRTAVGGAAYANGGEGGISWENGGTGGFYLDVNPYFGLQKWSMSTLSNHEGVTGHVFQFNYALEHPGSEYAVEIDSTAYAEGWGLFSEWLATQLGVYGNPSALSANISSTGELSNIKGVLDLPAFGVNSKTNNIENYSQYEYSNGTYWITPYSENNSKKAGNNQTYYDALQYFGFLNERQLRAMRITVDVGIHSGKNGGFAVGSGYSLNDARNYLKSNSGLGLDDIKRETKRYLEYTAQATSYYNGLIEMQNYFIKAKTAYENVNTDSQFMNWELPNLTNANTAPLFSLILRNGNVPLEALNWAVNEYLASLYK
ncbi:MAG: DUF885 domain-containing protein [Ureaplasma sp.]|nr:DUF885 domain-containing protein [Ureaplasma sp.]MDE7221906.1 DUF885 domain-containing protein [Ureaplasma sp.]